MFDDITLQERRETVPNSAPSNRPGTLPRVGPIRVSHNLSWVLLKGPPRKTLKYREILGRGIQYGSERQGTSVTFVDYRGVQENVGV